MTKINKLRWEARLRGETPKFIDIMSQGAPNSSGAVARIPIRDGFLKSALLQARLIEKAPELLDELKTLVAIIHPDEKARYPGLFPRCIALIKRIEEPAP